MGAAREPHEAQDAQKLFFAIADLMEGDLALHIISLHPNPHLTEQVGDIQRLKQGKKRLLDIAAAVAHIATTPAPQ